MDFTGHSRHTACVCKVQIFIQTSQGSMPFQDTDPLQVFAIIRPIQLIAHSCKKGVEGRPEIPAVILDLWQSIHLRFQGFVDTLFIVPNLLLEL